MTDGDIYESLALVVFQLSFIAAGAEVNMGHFYHHPLHGADRHFYTYPAWRFLRVP